MIAAAHPATAKTTRADTRSTVCQVVHCLSVGGAELLVAALARSLQSDYRFVFACLDEIGPVGYALIAEGFTVRFLERRPGVDWHCARRLREFLVEEKVELVHAHQYTPFFQAALSRGWRSGPPILFTEHGRHVPDRRHLSHVVCNRILTRSADHVVGVGRAVRDALVANEGFSEHRVGVVYNGVKLDPYLNAPRERRVTFRRELGLEDAFVIMQVARLNALKDHATALRTIERVAKEVPNARLVLVGEGEEREAIEAVVRERGLAHLVRFLGVRRDIPELLSAADCFLLTSISEGIPLTIIEAMASGLPVVCTSVGGIAEMIEDGRTGFLAPAGNDDELAKHLVRLARAPNLRTMLGTLGRQRAIELFGDGRMNDLYRALYEEMLHA